MKKAGIAGGLIALLMLLPVCSGVAVAGEKNGLETAAIGDIDFVVLAAVVYFGFKGLKLDRLDLKKEEKK